MRGYLRHNMMGKALALRQSLDELIGRSSKVDVARGYLR